MVKATCRVLGGNAAARAVTDYTGSKKRDGRCEDGLLYRVRGAARVVRPLAWVVQLPRPRLTWMAA